MFDCFYSRSGSTESLNADIPGPAVLNCRLIEIIQESFSITLSGKIPAGGDRFIIDFIATGWYCKDIALRLAFRASTNSLGRNSCINHRWGEEETSLVNPYKLVPSKKFVIEVFYTRECVYIAFNGIHVAKYVHRVDYFYIYGMKVYGDITAMRNYQVFNSEYPTIPKKTPRISYLFKHCQKSSNVGFASTLLVGTEVFDEEGQGQFLPLPYYAVFGRKFLKLGYTINITGNVSSNPNMITVALQEGICVWPETLKGIQIEFRFKEKRDIETDEPVIVFDSLTKDGWNGKVRSDVSTDLRPGADFNLAIVRGELAYEVHLNNKHIHDYSYSRNPHCMDTCFVEGDIQLLNVVIESD